MRGKVSQDRGNFGARGARGRARSNSASRDVIGYRPEQLVGTVRGPRGARGRLGAWLPRALLLSLLPAAAPAAAAAKARSGSSGRSQVESGQGRHRSPTARAAPAASNLKPGSHSKARTGRSKRTASHPRRYSLYLRGRGEGVATAVRLTTLRAAGRTPDTKGRQDARIR